MRLTDAQVEALAKAYWLEEGGKQVLLMAAGDIIDTEDVIALATEVQEYRALRSVMAAAMRAVNAGSFTPYDALAQIVAELASLDSRAVADRH